MGWGFTGHSTITAQIIQLNQPPPTWANIPLAYTHTTYCTMGAHTTSFGKYNPMWECLPSPTTPSYLPNTPNIPHAPNFPTPLIWVVPSLISTYLHLCSLIFFHRPEEAASVWRLQKLVCPKLDYTLCLIIQELIWHL